MEFVLHYIISKDIISKVVGNARCWRVGEVELFFFQQIRFSAALTCILLSVACAPIQPVRLLHFNDGNMVVAEKLEYEIHETGSKIIVPPGFVTDFASTPQIFWTFLPPFGDYQLAAVVHDYLYWDQTCTRKQADDVLRLAMGESLVHKFKAWIMYHAVRIAGEGAYLENAKEKKNRMLRFIPPEKMKIPPNTTWPKYRKSLIDGGIWYEPKYKVDPNFCTIAEKVADS